jgi:hypothetical protein
LPAKPQIVNAVRAERQALSVGTVAAIALGIGAVVIVAAVFVKWSCNPLRQFGRRRDDLDGLLGRGGSAFAGGFPELSNTFDNYGIPTVVPRRQPLE